MLNIFLVLYSCFFTTNAANLNLLIAHCRQKLDEANRSKESELADLRQHMSAIEQQLANSSIVSPTCILFLFVSLFTSIDCKTLMEWRC